MEKIYNNMTIVELANESLKKPEDFGWWGDGDMFVTWGWAGVDKHRDSGYLELSNFDVISRDLMERFPNDFKTVGIGHWAVGHADRLIVRVIEDENLGCVEDNITPAYHAAMEWLGWLEDYPIADESHYSDLCYGEFVALIRMFMPDMVRYVNDNLDETVAEIIEELLHNEHIYGYIEYYDEQNINISLDDIVHAAFRLKLIDPDYKDEWDEYCEKKSWPIIDWDDIYSWSPQIPGQMTIFDVSKDIGTY